MLLETLGAAVIDSDWIAAVDRATTRIGHTVSRELDRARRRHGTSPRGRHSGRAGGSQRPRAPAPGT